MNRENIKYLKIISEYSKQYKELKRNTCICKDHARPMTYLNKFTKNGNITFNSEKKWQCLVTLIISKECFVK